MSPFHTTNLTAAHKAAKDRLAEARRGVDHALNASPAERHDAAVALVDAMSLAEEFGVIGRAAKGAAT